MGEDLTELVVGGLADEGGVATHCSDPRHGVGGRSARGLPGTAHRGVKPLGRGLVEQLHRALGQSVGIEERLVARRDDVNDRVADCDNIMTGG